jgi:hypothetical protein
MQRLTLRLSLLAFFLCSGLQGGIAQTAPTPIPSPDNAAELVDAPVPVLPGVNANFEPGPDPQGTSVAPEGPAPKKRSKYAQIIEPLPAGGPGLWPAPLSAGDKLIFTLRMAARPVNWIVPPLYDASYEQLRGTDPKYGKGAGAFSVQFGAAQLRSISTRFLSDGVYAALFHQDPRYERIVDGGIATRAVDSAEQALFRHSDEGAREFNYSGILGRATSALLVLTYYPPRSRNSRVVFETFGTSVATNAGLNLLMEFLPDLGRRFPFVRKLLPE